MRKADIYGGFFVGVTFGRTSCIRDETHGQNAAREAHGGLLSANGTSNRKEGE